MSQYKTPDVYVREKSILPPSVAEVATAIPAFIGYTTKVSETDPTMAALQSTPVRITSMVEFEANFGGPYKEGFTVIPKATGGYDIYANDGNEDNTDDTNSPLMAAKFFLHQSVSHFFANGGGACFVVSVGLAGVLGKPAQADYETAIDLLNKVDEVTLISCPESIGLDATAHYSVQNEALDHSKSRMDRIALVDVLMQQPPAGSSANTNDALVMRNNVTSGLQYGASYYPYLRTTMARSYDEKKVRVHLSVPVVIGEGAPYALKVFLGDADLTDMADDYTYVAGSLTLSASIDQVYIEHASKLYALKGLYEVTYNATKKQLDKQENGDVFDAAMLTYAEPSGVHTLDKLGDPSYPFSSAEIYNAVKSSLAKNYLVLPPSPAVAGVMAKTDKERGVWKAPANVALSQVLAPSLAIDNAEQENLNVDAISGKSINAIRTFVGKGTLVWGARTLAGNDNEWRYVSVRRLFNMVEESIQKTTQFAVFEPNTPFTWLKLKTMIESYLENLWRQGAFFGESPAQAFFVNVGLGQTMTEDDINNGIMNIEIGLAAVRPAEFIVLTFSHKSLEG
ncbi:phage tail protein [Pseudoalteromonas sp. MSK9-3]|uniref:phage tail sheath family protein n=1 Tax=Pseudoalteromonas sp. MSK9-3 TaxID=1897633 RepID=UPI000E6D4AC0|nr:phage tail sheath C-terminal domain-containing protein [Pseudoalteromonas sp. MSK9-3]RJE76952.1 phage tail protein [Pseudoalteromonas sp. MSK9-3]